MIHFPFKIFSRRFLGVDVGTFSIKVVEISQHGDRKKLENYGELKASAFYKEAFRTFEKNTLSLSGLDVSRGIKAVIEETGIITNKAIFSLPDFSTFYTTLALPQMPKKEFPQAIQFEAQRYIPLSLSEVTLDWQMIEDKSDKDGKVKILLIAVPNRDVEQYKKVAADSHLGLISLEAEALGLTRALTRKDDKNVICLIDIGAQSTTINIIEKGILRISYSFEMSGNELTHRVEKSLNVGFKEAEKLKEKHGILTATQKKEASQILIPLIDMILIEVEKVSGSLLQKEKKTINEVILAGGTARLPGLKEYLASQFSNREKKMVIKIADPFSDIYCPPLLEETLKEIGPSYAVAVGAALKGFE